MTDATLATARALEAGATGYLLKDTSSDELMRAFDQVRSGKPYLSEDLAMRVALLGTGVGLNPLVDLTPRQSQMLSLLAKGKTPRSSASTTRPWSIPASTLSGGLARKICRS
jgi:DNA-binding NarL/FixJ family response regulator